MDCVFCKIIAGQIPSQKVYEDDDVVVIRDIAPVAPLHLLVIVKEHIPSAAALDESRAGLMARVWTKVIPSLGREHAGGGGFRVVVNSGRDAGQSVEHLHFHFLGGRTLGPVG